MRKKWGSMGLADLFALNKLVLGGSVFPRRWSTEANRVQSHSQEQVSNTPGFDGR